MIPEFGNFALVLAFGVSLVQSLSPWLFFGGVKASKVVETATRLQFVLVTLAISTLAFSFVRDDFSVLYVASNSNSLLPIPYKVAAVWGGHEGSMLLWVESLALWSVGVSFLGGGLPTIVRERALGVLGAVSAAFLSFILLTSNPFTRLFPVPGDGRDLNPLLQDPGMVMHPPLLYMGYVGFAVPFAISVAALINGKLDAVWARWTRPWTTAAWSFLTLGIALGSYWAYYELGWGGWWFWDPVENASFMPWLTGTALIHSLAVSERLGLFKAWSVLLSITTFALSLVGTFLVRSGVLTSVHAFASDPSRGLYILGILVVIVGAALLLYSIRAHKLFSHVKIAFMSREFTLLVNSLLLLAAAASVMLGTLYPLVLDALDFGKISVGAPYFETVFVPLMLPVVFLCGVGPLLAWRRTLLRRPMVTIGAFIASGFLAILAALIGGRWGAFFLIGVMAGAWVIVAACALIFIELREGGGGLQSVRWPHSRMSRAKFGMILAHIGLGAFILGVTFVKVFETDRDVRLAVGEVAVLGKYSFRLVREIPVDGPNYSGRKALIKVDCEGVPCALLEPEKRFYSIQRSTMTEAAIDSDFKRDLYVSLGERLTDGSWTMRIYIRPAIAWIWWACLIMALGGVLAVSDRRYRAPGKAKRQRLAFFKAPEGN